MMHHRCTGTTHDSFPFLFSSKGLTYALTHLLINCLDPSREEDQWSASHRCEQEQEHEHL